MRQYIERYGVSSVSLNQIYNQIKTRDDMDSERKLAPMQINSFPNTKIINNTCLKRKDTVKRMLSIVHKRFPELVIDLNRIKREKK
jgi:cytidylate kinase